MKGKATEPRTPNKAKDATANSISLQEVYPFPADEFVPLIDSLATGSTSFGVAMRYTRTGVQEPELRITAWLEPEGQAGGTSSELTLISLDHPKSKDGDFLMLVFEMPDRLAPARYALHIRADDPATKSRSETVSVLRIGDSRGRVDRS